MNIINLVQTKIFIKVSAIFFLILGENYMDIQC